MQFSDLDKPLNFHGDTEISREIQGPGNTPTLGVPTCVWDALNEPTLDAGSYLRKTKEKFGADDSKYCQRLKKNLHHKIYYAPVKCTCYDKSGNVKPCVEGCKHR